MSTPGGPTVYRVRIYRDWYPPHPWDDGDPLGQIVHWHPHQRFSNSDICHNRHDYPDPAAHLPRPLKDYLFVPLYMFDHSGIALSVDPFYCPWDSGQVGWVFVAKERVRKEFGWEVLTAKRIQEVKGFLRAAVEELNTYINGEVFGFVVEKAVTCPTCGHAEDEAWELTESCSGFYGTDIEKNGMLDHIPKDLWDLAKAAMENYEEKY